MGLRAIALGVSLALLAAAPAWADGESRPATAEEKAFFIQVLTACAKAAPTSLVAWEVTESVEPTAPDRLGLGAEESPLTIGCTVAWQDTARVRAAEEGLVADGVQVMQGVEQDKRFQTLTQRLEELSEAFGAAMERGDMAEAQRLRAQMEELGQQLEKAAAPHDQKMRQARADHAVRDAAAQVRIWVNSLGEDLPQGAALEPGPAGGRMLRAPGYMDPEQGWNEGVTTVFLGQWRQVADGDVTYLEAVAEPTAPHTSVQTVVVEIEAADQRAAHILKGMDWAALKALLAR